MIQDASYFVIRVAIVIGQGLVISVNHNIDKIPYCCITNWCKLVVLHGGLFRGEKIVEYI